VLAVLALIVQPWGVVGVVGNRTRSEHKKHDWVVAGHQAGPGLGRGVSHCHMQPTSTRTPDSEDNHPGSIADRCSVVDMILLWRLQVQPSTPIASSPLLSLSDKSPDSSIWH
jgi:hypothetical protein